MRLAIIKHPHLNLLRDGRLHHARLDPLDLARRVDASGGAVVVDPNHVLHVTAEGSAKRNLGCL